MNKKIKSIFALLALASFAFFAQGCGDENRNKNEIKLGLVGEHSYEWNHVAKELEKEGIKLTIVKFSDYNLPNRALNDGEIDANAFQHKAFLKAESEANGYKLTVIANTIIAPLGAYSSKIKSLDELKEGDKIAIPNDPTNGGRAIRLLESAGLITADKKKGYLVTVRDIQKNPKHLEIIEVDAGNTPSLLPDVAVSIINANYAIDTGFIPIRDAIYLDATGKIDENNPYINVLVSREDNKDDELLKKLIKAYQTKETAEIINKVYKGATIPVFKY